MEVGKFEGLEPESHHPCEHHGSVHLQSQHGEDGAKRMEGGQLVHRIGVCVPGPERGTDAKRNKLGGELEKDSQC